MPRKRQRTKARWEITSDQMLELVFGGPNFTDATAFSPTLPDGLRSHFESPFLRRAAWFKYGDEIMADHHAGHRPGAWWWYEARERPRGGESEVDCLVRLGVLQRWEEAQLRAWASIREESK